MYHLLKTYSVGSNDGIEIFEYREYYTVLALTFGNIMEFSAFNEVLIHWFVNELIKYWTPEINQSTVDARILIAYSKSTRKLL